VCFLEMKDKAAETLRKAAQAKPGDRDWGEAPKGLLGQVKILHHVQRTNRELLKNSKHVCVRVRVCACAHVNFAKETGNTVDLT
jgi:hypothetical protein